MADHTTPVFPMRGDEIATGLTMRDYFAAKAMQEMSWAPASMQACADKCYRIADAMLRAREVV